LEQLFDVLLSLHRGTPQYGEWVVACLEGAWPKLVGDRLAKVCRPVRFVGSELSVEILDNGWTEAVKSLKPIFLKKLQTATSCEIKSISLFVRQQFTASGHIN
jgi:hypothetical protein